jgi:FG-GAP repeat
MSFRLSNVRVASLLVFAFALGSVCAAQKPPVPVEDTHVRSAASPRTATSPGNWSQLAKLAPPTSSVGISGDTVAIGLAPFQSNAVANVFVKAAQGWRNTSPVATLSGPVQGQPIPTPVAIDGDTIVAAGNIGFGKLPGYAFVFVKPAGGWTNMSSPTAILSASDNSLDFGVSASISGDTIVIGSHGYFAGTPGTAYVFVKPAGGWHSMTETAKLTSSDGMKYDLFGYSVSISGGTITVGAPQFGNIVNPGPGKAYMFVKPSAGWTSMTQTAELNASDGVNGDAFGFAVAMDGDVVLSGAYVHNKFLGAAYVYQKPSSGWTNATETATLTAADGLISEFGNSLAISGRIAIVGAPFRGLPPNGSQGGVYVFEEPAGGWQNMAGNTVLFGSDAHYDTGFGTFVAINGKTLVAGDTNFGVPVNYAYVFGLP